MNEFEVREVAGVVGTKLGDKSEESTVQLFEGKEGNPSVVIWVNGASSSRLTIADARKLAAQLYRLAGRVEKRMKATTAAKPSNQAIAPRVIAK